MGNLDELLKDIAGDNASATKIAGDGLGTLADLSGAGAAVSAAYDLLVGTGDKGMAAMEAILSRIDAGLRAIGESLKGGHLIERFRALAVPVGNSLAVLDAVPDFLRQQNTAEWPGEIEKCDAAVRQLSDPNGFWRAVYADQVYWNDAGDHVVPVMRGLAVVPVECGYGSLLPPSRGDGTVFSYTYVLPAFAFTVFNFVAVGMIYEQQTFVADHADRIRGAAELLKKVHDQVVSEIVSLWPTYTNPRDEANAYPVTGQSLLDALMRLWSGAGWNAGVTFGIAPVPPDALETPNPAPPGVSVEYGAIEPFSGCSSIGNFEPRFAGFGHEGPVADPHSADRALSKKLSLRSSARIRDVYRDTGMGSVWQMINALNRVVGDPVLPPHEYAIWSMIDIGRRVYDVAPSQIVPPGPYRLSEIARFVFETAPVDVPLRTGGISLRELLTPTS